MTRLRMWLASRRYAPIWRALAAIQHEAHHSLPGYVAVIEINGLGMPSFGAIDMRTYPRYILGDGPTVIAAIRAREVRCDRPDGAVDPDLDEMPAARCDSCNRWSWLPEEVGEPCRRPLPGGPCEGAMIEPSPFVLPEQEGPE